MNVPVPLPSAPAERRKLAVYLPADLHAKLKAYAAARRSKMATIVLALIRREIELHHVLHAPSSARSIGSIRVR